MSKILIVGASSQSSPYLIKELISKGHEVCGTYHTNKYKADHLSDLFRYNIRLYSCDISNFNDIKYVLNQSTPDKICYLAGESSTSGADSCPDRAYTNNVISMHLWMDILHRCLPEVEFYNFSSIRIFEGGKDVIDETSVGNPQSTYSLTKKLAHETVNTYRSYYNMKCTNLIMDQHDSVYKPETFVIPKIMHYLRDISNGVKRFPLQMGNLNAIRNFGLTSEFMSCVSNIVDSGDYSSNLIVSNCVYRSIFEFISTALNILGINFNVETSIYGTRFILSDTKQPIVESYDRFNTNKRSNDDPIIVSNKKLLSGYNYPFTNNFHDIVSNLVNNYIGVSYVATSN